MAFYGLCSTLTKSRDELVLTAERADSATVSNQRQRLADSFIQKPVTGQCTFLANQPSLYFTQGSFFP